VGPLLRPCGGRDRRLQIQDMHMEEEEAAGEGGDGTLRPPPGFERGDVSLTIHVEKWGLKDAMSYYEPRVVVSVRDEKGKAVEAVQVGCRCSRGTACARRR
jgi:hypothetical protein